MNLGAPELVGLLILGGLAVIPAQIASGKGRNFGTWFVLGLFFFLPALVAALVISPAATSPATATVLAAIEQAPGSTQEQLALRTGLSVPTVLQALTTLTGAGMVRMDDTGAQFTLARQSVPVVRAYPARG